MGLHRGAHPGAAFGGMDEQVVQRKLPVDAVQVDIVAYAVDPPALRELPDGPVRPVNGHRLFVGITGYEENIVLEFVGQIHIVEENEQMVEVETGN